MSNNVPEQHRKAIAKRTLEMNDIMANMLGGMTKAEARAITDEV